MPNSGKLSILPRKFHEERGSMSPLTRNHDAFKSQDIISAQTQDNRKQSNIEGPPAIKKSSTSLYFIVAIINIPDNRISDTVLTTVDLSYGNIPKMILTLTKRLPGRLIIEDSLFVT